MIEYKIYLDQDGVITGFEEQIKKLTGKTPDQIRVKSGPKAFRDTVNQLGEPLWANMQWTPNGKKLWDSIKNFKPTILTAPMSTAGCHTGKKKWINRELGPNIPVIIDAQKYKYAENNAILIDDRVKNIQSWESAGGIGILHNDDNVQATIDKLNLITKSVRESKMNFQKFFEANMKPNKGAFADQPADMQPQRIPIADYVKLAKIIKERIKEVGKNFVISAKKMIENNKDSAGDMDVILDPDFREYWIEDIEQALEGHIVTSKKNGPQFMVVVKNLLGKNEQYMVDFILSEPGSFMYRVRYAQFGVIIPAVVGSFARSLGYKYDQNALYVRIKDERNNYHNVLLTNDYFDALDILKLDKEPVRLNDLYTAEKVAKWIIASPRFDSKKWKAGPSSDGTTIVVKNKKAHRAAKLKSEVQECFDIIDSVVNKKAVWDNTDYKVERVVLGDNFVDDLLDSAKQVKASGKISPVTGEEVMKILNISAGPMVGKILRRLNLLGYTRADALKYLDDLNKEKDAENYQKYFTPYVNVSWTIPGKVIKSCRPGYPGNDLGPSDIDKWFEKVQEKVGTIPKSIITFLTAEELGLFYTADLLQYYRSKGITVYHVPVSDPVYYHRANTFTLDQLYKVGNYVLQALKSGEGPVLYHCSAGQDRSGVVERYLKEMFKDGVPPHALYPSETYEKHYEPIIIGRDVPPSALAGSKPKIISAPKTSKPISGFGSTLVNRWSNLRKNLKPFNTKKLKPFDEPS